jgi:hypothetical protein
VSNFAESSRNQALAIFFLALSLADLLMTYLLLQNQPAVFTNPTPLLTGHSSRGTCWGLTIYKFVLAGIVITVCEVIERKRPAGESRVATDALPRQSCSQGRVLLSKLSNPITAANRFFSYQQSCYHAVVLRCATVRK